MQFQISCQSPVRVVREPSNHKILLTEHHKSPPHQQLNKGNISMIENISVFENISVRKYFSFDILPPCFTDLIFLISSNQNP